MDEKSSVVEFCAKGAKEIQSMRQWWLWSYAVIVTLVLPVAIASFAFPTLLSGVDSDYFLLLSHAVRVLVGLVLIFNVYVISPLTIFS